MSRRLLAALLLAVGAAGVALPAAAQDQPAEPDAPTTTALEDVTLRWGLNDESSNRAFAPDTYNFFSAGRIPDPGRGGTTIDRADWSSRDGAVRVEKWDGTAWRRATWAGLRTTSAGEPLGSPTAGTFSNHTVTVSGGDGVVDPVEGTATIAWEGEVTVLYYSGMSFFHLADPVLEVADGAGALTAEVSGYASSQADPDVWEPVAPERVTVADLPDVEVDALTDGSLDAGLSWRPAYLGVRVSGVPQQRDGEHAGSFPQSFVDVMDRLGTAAFLVIFVVDVVLAWALHVLFRGVHHDLSLLAAWCRLTYTVFLGVSLVFLDAALRLVDHDEELVLLALNAFDTTWVVGLAAFGVHLALLGRLMRLGGGPRWLAIGLPVAGAAYVADTLARLLLTDYQAVADLALAVVATPSVVFEMSLAIWLVLVWRGRARIPA